MTKHNVGDIASFHKDSYILILKLTGNVTLPYEGFFVFGKEWLAEGNRVVIFGKLYYDWWPQLVTDKKTIEYVQKKYLEHQLCEVIEK